MLARRMQMAAAGGHGDPTFEDLVAASGPLHWWKMGESSGALANSGSSSVTASVASGTPIYGQAAIGKSRGTSILINGARFRASSVNVPSGDVSWEILIRPTSFSGHKYIFGDENSGSRAVLRAESGDGGRFWMYHKNFAYWSDTGTLSLNTDYHIVTTFQVLDPNPIMRVYVNGSFVSSKTTSPGALGTITNWDIGNWSGNDRPFKGYLQHHAIYTFRLSADDILARAQALGLAA